MHTYFNFKQPLKVIRKIYFRLGLVKFAFWLQWVELSQSKNLSNQNARNFSIPNDKLNQRKRYMALIGDACWGNKRWHMPGAVEFGCHSLSFELVFFLHIFGFLNTFQSCAMNAKKPTTILVLMSHRRPFNRSTRIFNREQISCSASPFVAEAILIQLLISKLSFYAIFFSSEEKDFATASIRNIHFNVAVNETQLHCALRRISHFGRIGNRVDSQNWKEKDSGKWNACEWGKIICVSMKYVARWKWRNIKFSLQNHWAASGNIEFSNLNWWISWRKDEAHNTMSECWMCTVQPRSFICTKYSLEWRIAKARFNIIHEKGKNWA